MTPSPPVSEAIQRRCCARIPTRRAWLANFGDETEDGERREELTHAILTRHVEPLASSGPTSREDLTAQLHVHWVEHGPRGRDDDAYAVDDAEPYTHPDADHVRPLQESQTRGNPL